MTTKQRGPSTLSGAFVQVPRLGQPQTLPFQFNPANLQRSLHPQLVGGEPGDRSMAVRYTGAPIQTISLTVEFGAAEPLNAGEPLAQAYGMYPQLAALELMLAPASGAITQLQSQLAAGIMEVATLTAPAIYFVWGQSRVLPVRINQYTITEELFDSNLNPISISVQIEMRVLTYSDLDASNQGYQQYLVYQKTMESIAANAYGNLSPTGLSPEQFI